MTGLLPLGTPLIVTWRTPCGVSMSCSCRNRATGRSANQPHNIKLVHNLKKTQKNTFGLPSKRLLHFCDTRGTKTQNEAQRDFLVLQLIQRNSVDQYFIRKSTNSSFLVCSAETLYTVQEMFPYKNVLKRYIQPLKQEL